MSIDHAKAFDVPKAWKTALAPVLQTENTHALASYLADETKNGVAIFPQHKHWFHAIELVRPDEVRVVILGQDPYHGEGQAHGLAFSVQAGIKPPPSLKNIYKELQRDLDIVPPASGSLERWAEQGVLLLNSVLTVEAGKPGSHQKRGWEAITDAVIAHVGGQIPPTAFLLWGSHAQKKRPLIEAAGHLVLEAPHPSPLSAHRGFLGCGHFSAANRFLAENNRDPVQW